MIPHNICLLFAFMDPKRIQHFWGRGSVWDFYNHYLYFSKQFCESVRSRLGHGEKEAIMIDVILVQSHIPYCTGCWRVSECCYVSRAWDQYGFCGPCPNRVTWTTLNMAPRLHPGQEEVFLSNKFLIRKTHVADTMP